MELQVGVKVLIENKAHCYLLLQRSKPFPNGAEWDIPGGRIKATEKLGEALIREVQEETGIAIDSPLQLINAQDIIVLDKSLHVVRLTYRTQLDTEVIRLSDEHRQYKWVTLGEALGLNIDPYLREIL